MSDKAPEPMSPRPATKVGDIKAAEPQPIVIPVSINLPTAIAGKPLQLAIDITFED